MGSFRFATNGYDTDAGGAVDAWGSGRGYRKGNFDRMNGIYGMGNSGVAANPVG